MFQHAAPSNRYSSIIDMVDRICHNVTVEEERLAAIEAKLDALLAVVARLQPLIEKYAGPAMLDRWTRKRVK